MKRPESYNTKQREVILRYIRSLGGAHVTAAQIVAHLKSENASIGRTTVYRHLEKLTESGILRKYTTDGKAGWCFQYSEQEIGCREHFHLKCDTCGELLHLKCDMLDEIRRHVQDEHAFAVNTTRTVFYGRCGDCIRRGND